MHILLTGAAGRVGSHTLFYLLDRKHTVLATDVLDLPEEVASRAKEYGDSVSFQKVDLSHQDAVEDLVTKENESGRRKIEGLVHLGAIPAPTGDNFKIVHNNNVVGTYNILSSCASQGVKRIVQASSINAMGVSFQPEGHQVWEELPIDEDSPDKPEDPYALSKKIMEIQAEAMCRFYPGTRIASLRFHTCRPSLESAKETVNDKSLWSWVSYEACARGCELGLTSKGWEGAEAFYTCTDDLVTKDEDAQTSSLEMLRKHWDASRYKKVDESWWDGNPRRGFWNTEKAKRMLGWYHE